MFWFHFFTFSFFSCRETISYFIENDPSELNEADLTIARLKLIPYYEEKCPKFKDLLSSYDEQLEKQYYKK